MTAVFRVGDVFDRLAELPDGSVDVVITSPPFLDLRSYLPADHPDKAKEIGSEPTPAAFVDVLLAVTAELRRVLAPHGSICIELGDTFSGSGGSGGDYAENGLREGQEPFGGSARTRPVKASPDKQSHRQMGDGEVIISGGPGWPLAKSKALIPELYRIALAYGINPLTGQPSPAGQWRIRNTVTWCRPNPPPGALGDKWRPATSDVVVACVSSKRYWDDLATRTEADPANKRPSELKRAGIGGRTDQVMNPLGADGQRIISNPAGAPLLDWWSITAGGFKGAHYAVFPPALVEPLVKAMAPPRVCRTCGEPSRRIVDSERHQPNGSEPSMVARQQGDKHGVTALSAFPGGGSSTYSTLGFTDCGHDDWRPALILDPFAGSGTTLSVATGHGHDALGIDLDPRNADLALDRVGPLLLDVDTPNNHRESTVKRD